MPKWKPPEIEDVEEPFCGSRRRSLVPLIDADPDVAAEWCYKKNVGWGPEDFSHASTVKAWWECPFCLREYKAHINNRTCNLSACPYCASKRVCDENSFAILYPALAQEWHPKKNGKVRPCDVMYASGKQVYWLCSSCSHVWLARVSDRTKLESGCPACYEARMEYARQHPPPRKCGHVVLNENSHISRAWYEAARKEFEPLSKTHPRVAKQWHPTKNGDWKPSDFAHGSEAVVWWQCKKGVDHIWQSPIYSRTGKGRHHCPFCTGKRVSVTNSLKSLFPKVAKQWHPTLNGKLTPADVTAGSRKKVYWLCPRNPDHVWDTIVGMRTSGSQCPFCCHVRASKETNLKVLFPYIATQWHPTKNGALKPNDVLPSSSKPVWWICAKGDDHSWPATPANRTGRGSGCPFCSGRKASSTNSLAACFPEVASEWHKTKNGELSASDVTPKSKQEVWWQCSKKKAHVWHDSVQDRTTRKRGCTLCKKGL